MTSVKTLQASGVMVARGDGKVLGWYARKSHEMLGSNGVGQIIHHDITMVRVNPPEAERVCFRLYCHCSECVR